MNLEQFPDYDPSNRVQAMNKIMETNGLVTGLIYQNKTRKSYEDMITGFKPEALAKQNIKITPEEFDKLVAEFEISGMISMRLIAVCLFLSQEPINTTG